MSFFRLLQRPPLCSLCRARGFASTATSRAESAKAAAASASGRLYFTPSKHAPASKFLLAAVTPMSSCAQDTVLTGVNYLKGQPPVLAAADEEYPAWLWTILQPKVWPDDGPGGKAERVKRRIENKQGIKDRNFMSTQ
ncbi:hypothetical protein C0991_003180 [Blastosporella zonata]|nr:hypothetical protein C0991_003180 [Blastosporella zonata]